VWYADRNLYRKTPPEMGNRAAGGWHLRSPTEQQLYACAADKEYVHTLHAVRKIIIHASCRSELPAGWRLVLASFGNQCHEPFE